MEKGKPNPYSKRKIKQTDGYAICISIGLNIWSSPWILSILGYKPFPNPSISSLLNLSVSDLMMGTPTLGMLLSFTPFFMLIQPPKSSIYISLPTPEMTG
jgi:hypothetical protein